jgi:tetratricopeptide (TPR) repeat protein
VRLAAAVLCLCWLAAPVAAAGAADASPGSYPLLELAREIESAREPPGRVFEARELRYYEHALAQARPPSDEDCARSMASGKFAELHMDVAATRRGHGDLSGALAAYRHASACRPRDTRILRLLAEVLLESRDPAGASAAVQQGLNIDPRNLELNRLAGELDFLAERWADAVARFRFVASGELDREQAGFAQLMLWLSQLRAGSPAPELVPRRPSERWPNPLLLYMRGEYTEADLVEPIRQGDADYGDGVYFSTDTRLSAALFYVGQARWARGELRVARDYFAALMNIRPRNLEHGLALAEIAKLNQR